jgi:hypothetical protein
MILSRDGWSDLEFFSKISAALVKHKLAHLFLLYVVYATAKLLSIKAKPGIG